MNNINWKRSLVKGTLWELIGLVVIYLITKNISMSVLYITIRVLLYPLHEYLWKQIRWFK